MCKARIFFCKFLGSGRECGREGKFRKVETVVRVTLFLTPCVC